MEQVIENAVTLPKVSVQLTTVKLGAGEGVRPPHSEYYLCQRLSDDHSPLRIDNFVSREAFPRVRSVGFLPPGRSVQLYPMEKPFRALICAFDKAFFEATTEIGFGDWEEHTGALVSIRNRRIELMMQQMCEELVQPGFAHNLLVESASTMMIVELARHTQQLDRCHDKHGGGQGLAPWQLRRIRERIQASLEIGYPNLSELAGLCGISQSHLMRTFKASTGWQLHKYIAEERLNAAKLLLAGDQLSSKEVSARLGFSSPAYFATAFRRSTGKTPTEYQRHARAMGNA